MCIETQSLATALLPQFASEIGYDVQLMRLLSAYQLNPGTETYNAVKNYLSEKRSQQQQTLNTFNTGKRLDLNILDYENNLLWSTASLAKQDKIVLTYQASEYSQQATEGSAYQKFEDGSEYNLSWVSGGPLFTGGGAFKIGTLTAVATNTLTITTTGATVSTYVNPNNVSYTLYTFNESGTLDACGNVYDASGNEIDVSSNYFLVGGGGTGGNNNEGAGGGGGGAGGEVYQFTGKYTGQTQNISVTIGAGGIAGSSQNNNEPSNGGSTLATDKQFSEPLGIATGGLCGGNGGDGYGGAYSGQNGNEDGGTYTAGGWYAGGGGGAGGAGADGGGSSTSNCGNYGYGGVGTNPTNTYFPAGSYGAYAAGGGGGQNNTDSECGQQGNGGEQQGGGSGGFGTSTSTYGTAGSGAPGTGAGGGGACISNNTDAKYIGGGGSGVFIFSVKSSYLAT